MAHFAELDSDNNVLNVIVVSNDDITVDGVESEAKGIEFLKGLFGEETIWVQTSYNANFRGVFAGLQTRYDPDKDIFYFIEEQEV